ncbi:MAG: hypothetical protein ACERLM_03165, partial [Acidimicrobiales bacterium]
ASLRPVIDAARSIPESDTEAEGRSRSRKLGVARDQHKVVLRHGARRSEVNGVISPQRLLFSQVTGGPNEILADFEVVDLGEQHTVSTWPAPG